jgi:hypothetical protein
MSKYKVSTCVKDYPSKHFWQTDKYFWQADRRQLQYLDERHHTVFRFYLASA